MNGGLILAEAPHGSLQEYLEFSNNHAAAALSQTQRWAICEEISEAMVHIHKKGVVHSDLRPDNILVHAAAAAAANASDAPPPPPHIWLADFGGSTCASLGLDGGHLPDTPFFDPRSAWESTPATDIFSLGSIFYTILAGHWPFLDEPLDPKDQLAYEERVEQAFRDGRFPQDLDCEGNTIVMGCWQYKLETTEQILEAIKDLRNPKQ